MKILDFPHTLQAYSYDCGAAALQSVLAYNGIEKPLSEIIKYAGTTAKGTNYAGFVKVAKKFSLSIESKSFSIEEVKLYLKKNIPVIICLQAWTQRNHANFVKSWHGGHYVVAIGYSRNKIIFEDPYVFNRSYLSIDELKTRWHNMDKNKKQYNHGIAIWSDRKTYKNSFLIHMN